MHTGADVSCCEGDGINTPCVPTQCPLLAPEPLAPFGALPIDPFLAEIKGCASLAFLPCHSFSHTNLKVLVWNSGKCLCPEPQECSA